MICFKRILCLFLAILLVIPFASCGENEPVGDQGKDTTASDTTNAPVSDEIYYEPDELPELDFGGETVTFLSPDSEDGGFSFFETQFTVEELSSNILNDSIYNRELYVEDRLGVEIENIKVVEIDTEIEKIMNSGDETYDAVISTGTFLSNCGLKGYLLDLYEVEHIDLDKPWWSQNFSDEAEILGELYLATGAIFQSLIRSTYAVYYNKNLALDYVESTPELSDLYGLVDSGKWTIDKFIELGGDVYVDMNGNSTRDLDDIYGIAYDKYTPVYAFWSGFDVGIFSRTQDGWFEFDVNTDKLYTSLDKIFTVLYRLEGSITADVGTTAETSYSCDYPEVHFASGTNLFLVERLGFTEKESMRNMQDDYGVLPYPKYDENQKDYYSFSNTSFAAVAIPVLNSSPKMAGAVIEAMASYSYRETRPLYLDTVLKGQYMSDPDSRRMIDIVIDGITIDAAWIYYDTLSNKYTEEFLLLLRDKKETYSSTHESAKRKINTILKTYKKQLEE